MQFIVSIVVEVLTVWLACTAAASAQLLPGKGGLGAIGAEVGGRVGSGIGGGVGSALDKGLSVPGVFIPKKPEPGNPTAPSQPSRPFGSGGPAKPEYNRNDGYSNGNKNYEGGSNGANRRGYENQNFGGAFDKGQGYRRDVTVKENERGFGYAGGRVRRGGSRRGSSGDYVNYGTDNIGYGRATLL